MNEAFSIDRVLKMAFEVYGQRLGRLLGTAAIAYLGSLVVFLALAFIGALVGQLVGGRIGAILVGAAIGFVVVLVAAAAYAGSVVRLVDCHQRGVEPDSIIDTLKSLKPRLWPIIWVQIMLGVGVVIGFILLIVPGIYLLVVWSVVLPVVVLEGLNFDAFRRSRALVKGSGWSVFGVGVIYVAASIALNIVQAIIQAGLGQAAAGFFALATSILLVPVVMLLVSGVYFELVRVSGAAQGSGSDLDAAAVS